MGWAARANSIRPGDTVRPTRELAESLSNPASADAKGKVMHIDGRIANVRWNLKGMPEDVPVVQLKVEKERTR